MALFVGNATIVTKFTNVINMTIIDDNTIVNNSKSIITKFTIVTNNATIIDDTTNNFISSPPVTTIPVTRVSDVLKGGRLYLIL